MSVNIHFERFKMKNENYLELLKEFKKSSGWSYHKLSNHLGVHYQTVISWFLEQRNPSPMALERIRKFLKSVEKSKTSATRKK